MELIVCGTVELLHVHVCHIVFMYMPLYTATGQVCRHSAFQRRTTRHHVTVVQYIQATMP